MIRTDVYIPESIKPLILKRANELDVNVSEYFRMLAINDISKEQLKQLHSKEEKLIDEIETIQNKLNNK